MSDEQVPKKYSIKLKSVPFILEDAAGQEQTCTLMELTGDERNQFLTRQAERSVGLNGKDKRPNYKGACSELLCMCVYDAQGRKLSMKEIDNWPSDMQMTLFLQAVELSGLDKKAEEKVKND